MRKMEHTKEEALPPRFENMNYIKLICLLISFALWCCVCMCLAFILRFRIHTDILFALSIFFTMFNQNKNAFFFLCSLSHVLLCARAHKTLNKYIHRFGWKTFFLLIFFSLRTLTLLPDLEQRRTKEEKQRKKFAVVKY